MAHADQQAPEDGAHYFIRTKSGLETVAKYIGEYGLFFAVGDAIGYFARDIQAIGRRVAFDGAFDA